MDYRQIQDILTQDIENLSKIRDRLSDKGEELSLFDKQTLRFHLSGTWLTDMQREQRSMFAEGAEEEIKRNSHFIIETMKQIS